jgi:hypothetical protein
MKINEIKPRLSPRVAIQDRSLTCAVQVAMPFIASSPVTDSREKQRYREQTNSSGRKWRDAPSRSRAPSALSIRSRASGQLEPLLHKSDY